MNEFYLVGFCISLFHRFDCYYKKRKFFTTNYYSYNLQSRNLVFQTLMNKRNRSSVAGVFCNH